MVNQYTKRPPTEAPRPVGLPCGECGLPGLRVDRLPTKDNPAALVPALTCFYCARGQRRTRRFSAS